MNNITTQQLNDAIGSIITISIVGLLFYLTNRIIKFILEDRVYTWLKPEEYKEVEKVASRWAIERTLALLPPGTPLPTVKRVASQMQSKIYELYGISPEEVSATPPKTTELPPVLPPKKEKVPRRAKHKEVELEDMVADLGARLLDLFKKQPALSRQPDEELAKSIQAWAKTDYGVEISVEDAIEIVKQVRGMVE